MFGKSSVKRAMAAGGHKRGVAYTFDRNGSLVVDTRSLMTNKGVWKQISAGAKIPPGTVLNAPKK
ncbi:MAG TPA: hypothetical protein VGK80_03370 [Rhodanobacteraceae bacterium]